MPMRMIAAIIFFCVVIVIVPAVMGTSFLGIFNGAWQHNGGQQGVEPRIAAWPDEDACETVIVVPPVWREQRMPILLRENPERLEVVPATYRTVNETIVVEEAHREGDVLENEAVTVVVEAASESLKIVPPVYERRTIRYMTVEGYTSYRLDEDGAVESVRHSEETAEISISVIATPAMVRRVAVPSKTATVIRKVVKDAVGTGAQVPAKTRTVVRRVLDIPASVRRIPSDKPVEVYTETVRVLDTPSSVERIPETCK